MSDNSSSTPASEYSILDSNADARLAIAEVLASATQEISIFDRTPQTLRDRDLGRPEVIETLRALLTGGRNRRLRIALHEVTGIETELPRLMNLLGQLGAQIAIHRVNGAAREVEDVLILADDHSFWRKPVHSHPRSIFQRRDPTAARVYRERFGEIWESSELAVTDRPAGL
jgi:hypothetical protein